MTKPSFIFLVVEAIAQLKKLKETDVAGQVLQNFANFFGITVIHEGNASNKR